MAVAALAAMADPPVGREAHVDLARQSGEDRVPRVYVAVAVDLLVDLAAVAAGTDGAYTRARRRGVVNGPCSGGGCRRRVSVGRPLGGGPLCGDRDAAVAQRNDGQRAEQSESEPGIRHSCRPSSRLCQVRSMGSPENVMVSTAVTFPQKRIVPSSAR